MRIAKRFTLCLLSFLCIGSMALAANISGEDEAEVIITLENESREPLTVSILETNLLVCHCSTGQVVIRVYDLTGTLLLSETTENEESNLDLHDLASGKYYFAVTDETGNYCSESFEIQEPVGFASN